MISGSKYFIMKAQLSSKLVVINILVLASNKNKELVIFAL